jgi:hypothetical protein
MTGKGFRRGVSFNSAKSMTGNPRKGLESKRGRRGRITAANSPLYMQTCRVVEEQI